MAAMREGRRFIPLAIIRSFYFSYFSYLSGPLFERFLYREIPPCYDETLDYFGGGAARGRSTKISDATIYIYISLARAQYLMMRMYYLLYT